MTDKFSLIITAGGMSSRYGNKNKLLEVINNCTVIEHTINKFLEFDEISQIIIPANSAISEILHKILNDKRIIITKGGENRQASVYNALQLVKEPYVLIHDGARPLIKKEIISNVLNCLPEKKAISVMVKTTDTIKEVNADGLIIKTIDRSKLYNTQTPQAFETNIIKAVHEKLKGSNYTDDCSMLEELNIPVYIVEGDYKNIKITTKSDLDFAKIHI